MRRTLVRTLKNPVFDLTHEPPVVRTAGNQGHSSGELPRALHFPPLAPAEASNISALFFTHDARGRLDSICKSHLRVSMYRAGQGEAYSRFSESNNFIRQFSFFYYV